MSLLPLENSGSQCGACSSEAANPLDEEGEYGPPAILSQWLRLVLRAINHLAILDGLTQAEAGLGGRKPQMEMQWMAVDIWCGLRGIGRDSGGPEDSHQSVIPGPEVPNSEAKENTSDASCQLGSLPRGSPAIPLNLGMHGSYLQGP